MKKKTAKLRESPLKAYRITMPAGDYFVAAANKPQAIGTLMAQLEEDDEHTIGPCAEVNPKQVVVHFEKDEGYEKGSLAEIMPTTDVPEVLIDAEYP